MFSTTDTIVAIATPAGRGGLGVVRVSGGDAHRIACALLDQPGPLAPRHATFARLVLADPSQTHPGRSASPSSGHRRPIDEVVATFFPRPGSYTAEDTVEISAHGSPVVLRAIVRAAVAAGARMAEPGEFTLRAFLNGRIDLVQAEAVADLIDAVTPRQARAAFDQLNGTLTQAIGAIDAALFDLIARLEASLDFPDEGYHFIDPGTLDDELAEVEKRMDALLASAGEGRLVREGLQAVIVGKPNVGKSTLFNMLVGAERAIVTEEPGTTRDLVTESVDVDGVQVRLVDTAGLRETAGTVETEGVERARQAAGVADVQLVVLDVSRPLEEEDGALFDRPKIDNKLFIINKIDKSMSWNPATATGLAGRRQAAVSLATGQGVDDLRRGLSELLGTVDQSRTESVPLTNTRHIELLERARGAVGQARAGIRAQDGRLSEEFVLPDLHEARGALEEIRGQRAPEELLRHIFSRFCIGK